MKRNEEAALLELLGPNKVLTPAEFRDRIAEIRLLIADPRTMKAKKQTKKPVDRLIKLFARLQKDIDSRCFYTNSIMQLEREIVEELHRRKRLILQLEQDYTK